MTNEQIAALPRVLLVAVGFIETSAGKRARGFVEMTREEIDTEFVPALSIEVPGTRAVAIYAEDATVRKYLGGSAGSVYEVPKTPNGSIIPGHASFLRRHHEAGIVWGARSIARERDYAARRIAAKDQKDRPDLRALEPIRRAYQQMNGAQRAQYLALVVNYLHRTSPGTT